MFLAECVNRGNEEMKVGAKRGGGVGDDGGAETGVRAEDTICEPFHNPLYTIYTSSILSIKKLRAARKATRNSM